MIALRARTVAALLVVGFVAARTDAWAQDDHAAHTAPTPQAAAVALPQWQWIVDANAFIGFNYQYRKFRDFNAFESQNWVMATSRRSAARGTVVVSSMLSLEALTLRDPGRR